MLLAEKGELLNDTTALIREAAEVYNKTYKEQQVRERVVIW